MTPAQRFDECKNDKCITSRWNEANEKRNIFAWQKDNDWKFWARKEEEGSRLPKRSSLFTNEVQQNKKMSNLPFCSKKNHFLSLFTWSFSHNMMCCSWKRLPHLQSVSSHLETFILQSRTREKHPWVTRSYTQKKTESREGKGTFEGPVTWEGLSFSLRFLTRN